MKIMFSNMSCGYIEKYLINLGIEDALVIDQGNHFVIWFTNMEDLNLCKLSDLHDNCKHIELRIRNVYYRAWLLCN